LSELLNEACRPVVQTEVSTLRVLPVLLRLLLTDSKRPTPSGAAFTACRHYSLLSICYRLYDGRMKYLFGSFPGADDVFLIESGSPDVSLRVVDKVRTIFPKARYHVLTCWPETAHTPRLPPKGPYASLFRAADYPTTLDKLRLLLSLARRRWRVLVILCTGEQVLWRWKMLALVIFPSKILIANENADFFWLDWAHRRNLRQFIAVRGGVNRDEIAATILRAMVLPFTFLFLLLTALYLYTRRWRRLLMWKLRPVTADARRSLESDLLEPPA
jgi:hypothetical protein